MLREQVERLSAVRGFPAVSVLLPTHRGHPQSKQDSIRVKNLVQRAKDRLLAAVPRRDAEPLLARLDTLANEIDYRHTLDGLALYLNQHLAERLYLPFAVKEQVVIGETFLLRDLVFAMNRSPRYWILVLSERPTRLYHGSRDTLVEVTSGGFPMEHVGPGATQPLPSGYGVKRSAHRDEAYRQFFRQVYAAFTGIAAADPLPLVVVGVEHYLAVYSEVANHKSQLVGTLAGSHDKTRPHELAALVWPLMREHLDRQKQKALADLECAIGNRQSASGIGEVWRLALEGRGAVLLVEEAFQCPARLDATGRLLTPAASASEPGAIDDAVDRVIQMVLAKGGQVVFVENGGLQTHQRIALILRY